jgi:hypothetical protein
LAYKHPDGLERRQRLFAIRLSGVAGHADMRASPQNRQDASGVQRQDDVVQDRSVVRVAEAPVLHRKYHVQLPLVAMATSDSLFLRELLTRASFFV